MGNSVQLTIVGELLSRLHVEYRPDGIDVELSPVDCWSSRDDPIVGRRILLSKFEALATTLGASIPVGIQWSLTVEAFDQLLRNTSL